MVAEVEHLCRNHTQPLWFDNPKQAGEWEAAGMPNYDRTFAVDESR